MNLHRLLRLLTAYILMTTRWAIQKHEIDVAKGIVRKYRRTGAKQGFAKPFLGEFTALPGEQCRIWTTGFVLPRTIWPIRKHRLYGETVMGEGELEGCCSLRSYTEF